MVVDRTVPSPSSAATGSASATAGSWRRTWLPWVLIAGAGTWYLDALRVPSTFYFDEWDFVLDQRPFGAEVLLQAHNGHASLIPVAAYRALTWVVGTQHYRAYRWLGIAAHLFVATSLVGYSLGRRRWRTPAVPLAVGAVVLFLGAGWENVLWPFQIGFMLSVGAGLTAWMIVDATAAPSRARRVCAALAIGVSLASSGVGVAFTIGLLARLVMRRDLALTAQVLAAPVALYGLWYAVHGDPQGSIDNLQRLPRFLVDAAASAAGGIFGRDVLWGRLGLGVLVGVSVVWRSRLARPEVVSVISAALANWALTAYSRADVSVPGSSRYMYVGAVLLLVLVVELVRDTDPGPPLVVLLAALSVWGNHRFFDAGAAVLREASAVTRAELRALEWAEDVPPDYRPDTVHMPQVAAGPYLELVARSGAPSASDGEVLRASAEVRAAVDRVALELLGFGGGRAGAPGVVGTRPAGELAAACRWIDVPGTDVSYVARLDVAGGVSLVLDLDEDASLRLARFGSLPEAPDAFVTAGPAGAFELAADRAPIATWTVEVSSTAPFRYCMEEHR